MTDKTLKEHVKKCGDLKSQIDKLTAQYNNEKSNITLELITRGINAFSCAKYAVKLSMFTVNRFDSKMLKNEYPALYDEYTKQVQQNRFTVNEI